MESLSLSFYLPDGENFVKQEIPIPSGANLPFLEVVCDLGNAEVIAIRPTQDLLLVNSWIRSRFKWGLLWVVHFQTKAINRKKLLEAFPQLEEAKAHGKHFNQTLELCHAVLEFRGTHGMADLPYQNALEWWRSCMSDMLAMMVAEAYEPWEGKSTLVKQIRADFQALKTFAEPKHWDDELKRKTPHLNRLLCEALKIGPNRSNDSPELRLARKEFRDRDWRNYLNAYEAMLLEHKKTNRTYAYPDNGVLCVSRPNAGKGIPKKQRVFPSEGFKSGRGRKKKSK